MKKNPIIKGGRPRTAGGALLVGAIWLGFAPAHAADAGVGSLAQRYEELKTNYERQARELTELRERMVELERQFRGMGVPPGRRVGPIAQSTPSPTPAPSGAPESTPAATDKPGADDKVVKEPPRTRSVEAIYQQREALFERRFTLEPSITYSRFDRRLINLSGFLALDAIFLGVINVQQTKSDLFTFDLTGRWGVTDRLQLDANIPYLYRDSQFFSGGAGGAAVALSEAKVDQGGLGDISVGANYQLFREMGSRPDIVLNARLKAPTGKDPYGIKVITPVPGNNNLNVPQRLPTGSGIWSASVGVSALKTVDPAIVYGNIGYIHNFSQSFDDISTQVGVITPGEVDLGNAFTWGAGVAFALNEQMSMSFGFSQLIADATRTKPRGGTFTKVIGSDANAATFNFGLTYALGRRTTLVTNFGIGLTPDAPDFSLTLRLPFGL